MSTQSPETASTPISAGGWKYNHDDKQDRADFGKYSCAELANLEANARLDFSDHPNRPLRLEPSPDGAGWIVGASELQQITRWLEDLGRYLGDETDEKHGHPGYPHWCAATDLHYELTLAMRRAPLNPPELDRPA